MPLSDLGQHLFAYYLAHGARELDMTPRFWPYAELVLIVEDKIMIAVRQFDVASTVECRAAAAALLDILIERQGFSTRIGSLGEKAHRYQPEEFRQAIDHLLATDPIILKARNAGFDFWKQAFALLRPNGQSAGPVVA